VRALVAVCTPTPYGHVLACWLGAVQVRLIVEVGSGGGSAPLVAIKSLAGDPEGRLHTACTALHPGLKRAFAKVGKMVPQEHPQTLRQVVQCTG
jgi:hypothetical protein